MQYECSQCGYAFEPFAEEAAGPFCDCPRCGGLAVESQSGGAAATGQAQGDAAHGDMRQTLHPFHGQTGSRPLSPGLFENYFENSDASQPGLPQDPEQEHDPFDDVIESREFDPGDIHREPTMLFDEDGHEPQALYDQNLSTEAPAAVEVPQDPFNSLPLPPPRHNTNAPGFYQESTQLADEPERPAPKPITGIMPVNAAANEAARVYDEFEANDDSVNYDDAENYAAENYDDEDWQDSQDPGQDPGQDPEQAHEQQNEYEEYSDPENRAPNPNLNLWESSDPEYAAQDEAYTDNDSDDDDDDDDDRPTEVTLDPRLLGLEYDNDNQSSAAENSDDFLGELPQAPAFSSLLNETDDPEQAEDNEESDLLAAFSGVGHEEATRGERRSVRSGGHEAEMLAEAPRAAAQDGEYSQPDASLSGEMLISRRPDDSQDYDDEQSLELGDGEITGIGIATDSEPEHSGDWMVSGPVRPPSLPKRKSQLKAEKTGEYAQLKDVQLPELERPADREDELAQDADDDQQKSRTKSKGRGKTPANAKGRSKPRPAKAARKDRPARLLNVPIAFALLAVSLIALLIGAGSAFWAHEAANKVANLSAQARALKLLGQANKLLAEGDNEEAIEILKRAAIDDPSLVAVQRSLGSAYARIKHEDDAAKAYEYYVRMSPNAPDAEKVRSILRKHRGG